MCVIALERCPVLPMPINICVIALDINICVIALERCPVLPMPRNAQVTPIQCSSSSPQVQPDTSCYYTCNEEFELSSSSAPGTTLRRSALRICYRNGTWSGNPLTCNRVCPPQVHPVNGMVSMWCF